MRRAQVGVGADLNHAADAQVAIAGPAAPAVLALAHVIEAAVNVGPFVGEVLSLVSALYRKGPMAICESGGI